MTPLFYLRMFFGMMLMFGSLHLWKDDQPGPMVKAFDYSLVIVGAVGSTIMLIFGWGKLGPGTSVKCAGCGTRPPLVRRPANRRQTLWGGWTCQECGCEMDRAGRKVENA